MGQSGRALWEAQPYCLGRDMRHYGGMLNAVGAHSTKAHQTNQAATLGLGGSPTKVRGAPERKGRETDGNSC